MGINLRETDVQQMNMCELAYNDCYVKDKNAMYRNYDMDISARDLIRNLFADMQLHEEPAFYTDDEYFDEVMFDNLQCGFETKSGILANLYQLIWTKAEMREVLLKASKGQDIKTLI